jgi:hypothetical protein
MTELPSPRDDARLQDAVERLYRVFSAPTPRLIDGCPCCLEKRGVDVLLTTPLRQLTGQALWSYVSGVFYTVGSEEDFRYLLPRILDIAVHDPNNSNDAEIVLCKVGLANWQAWSPQEREAIWAFVDAWFEHALRFDVAAAAEGDVGWEAEGVLCGAARGNFPLETWLARLQEPDAAPVLLDLKGRSPDRLSAFWEDVPGGASALTAIL